MRRVPGEVERTVTEPGAHSHDDRLWHVALRGSIDAHGVGATEAAAHKAAEASYEDLRSALVRDGEAMTRPALVALVGDVLYAYHQALTQHTGRMLPPGTPLPAAVSPVVRQRFRAEAEHWLGRVQEWETMTADEDVAASARGEARAGIFGRA